MSRRNRQIETLLRYVKRLNPTPKETEDEVSDSGSDIDNPVRPPTDKDRPVKDGE